MFGVGCLLIKVPPTFYANACQKLKFVCHTYCKIQTVRIGRKITTVAIATMIGNKFFKKL